MGPMDLRAQYQEDSEQVLFHISTGGERRFCRVTFEALAVLSRGEVTTMAQAIAAYQSRWRHVHAAALGLHAQGQTSPLVQSPDVQ
jgi:hypothetical protein